MSEEQRVVLFGAVPSSLAPLLSPLVRHPASSPLLSWGGCYLAVSPSSDCSFSTIATLGPSRRPPANDLPSAHFLEPSRRGRRTYPAPLLLPLFDLETWKLSAALR